MKNKKVLKFISIVGALSLFIVPCSMGNTSAQVDTVDLRDTVWRFDERIDLYDIIGGMGDVTFNVNFYTVTNTGGIDSYTSIIFAMDYTAEGGSQIVYDALGSSYVVYDNSSVGNGWREDWWRTIYITGGNVDEMTSLYNFLSMYADNITESYTSSFNVFQTIYDLINDLFFYGTVGMGDNTMQSLILLLLTSIFTIAFIIIPFVVVYWVLRWLGSLFNAI